MIAELRQHVSVYSWQMLDLPSLGDLSIVKWKMDSTDIVIFAPLVFIKDTTPHSAPDLIEYEKSIVRGIVPSVGISVEISSAICHSYPVLFRRAFPLPYTSWDG
jgi:hypothetical protein